MKKIYLTVTNDLSYDQRMQRICGSLASNGYDVTLVGRKLRSSIALDKKNYKEARIRCWFNKGKLFYAEYNFRLLLFLLFKKMDAICAIDLDTILPCYYISVIKKIHRIYDAHELFTELREVIDRPKIQRTWTRIEKKYVPRFKYCYTVSDSIAEEFNRRYGNEFKTIRNVPVLQPLIVADQSKSFLLYQGAVNEARGFEYLVPAMQWINLPLVICGDGNFMNKLQSLITKYGVADKIDLRGMMKPAELWTISQQATIGIALAEKEGLNQYLALPNKFFDYLHATLPQVTMNYPEYRKINLQYEVAVLMDDLEAKRVADSINNLLANTVLYAKLKANCMEARKWLNWQEEEKKLIEFYRFIFAS